MWKHKGYTGECWVDTDAGVIRGRVVGTRDVITFQGKTPDEARTAFAESVDDYLEFCTERGESPEKPYSGRVLLRLNPETHRELAQRAESEGVSFNSLVSRLLTEPSRKRREAGSRSAGPFKIRKQFPLGRSMRVSKKGPQSEKVAES